MLFVCKKYLQMMLRNNLYIPPKKITKLAPQEFIFLKWKYSKEIKYAKSLQKKEEAKNFLEKLLKPVFDNCCKSQRLLKL